MLVMTGQGVLHRGIHHAFFHERKKKERRKSFLIYWDCYWNAWGLCPMRAWWTGVAALDAASLCDSSNAMYRLRP